MKAFFNFSKKCEAGREGGREGGVEYFARCSTSDGIILSTDLKMKLEWIWYWYCHFTMIYHDLQIWKLKIWLKIKVKVKLMIHYNFCVCSLQMSLPLLSWPRLIAMCLAYVIPGKNEKFMNYGYTVRITRLIYKRLVVLITCIIQYHWINGNDFVEVKPNYVFCPIRRQECITWAF